MKNVPFYDIQITGGFWANQQKTNNEKTVWAVYDRFKETGRIDTMDCKVHDIKPHIFWGSDVFKWIEGASYILENKKDDRLLTAVNEIVDMIEEGSLEDGYYNSYYNNPEVTDMRFTNRNNHELYSLGHMIEAGVALFHATGDDKLLRICCKNADLVDEIFRVKDSASFMTPGHQEIELALVRLYEVTENKKYLDLAEFFVRKRGNNDKDTPIYSKENIDYYTQSHLPVTEQNEAVGHSVRAVYLYCAIADLAKELKDAELLNAAKNLFDDIYNKKMYITGGIGSLANGEQFSLPYHLPNLTAYAETCAALGLALFGRRLYSIIPDGRYGDAVERALYNGMISGLSLSGDAFFYVNPLEIDVDRLEIPRQNRILAERQSVFGCSCCPPNLVRLIPSVGDFIYTYENDYVYIHQYIANTSTIEGEKITLETDYPVNGKVHITHKKPVALRKPAWCDEIITNSSYKEKDGYLYFETGNITIEFVMKPIFYSACSSVHENAGKVALMRGPIVYCIEEQDQSFPIFDSRIDIQKPVTVTNEYFGGYPILEATGVYTKTKDQSELYFPATTNDKPCKLRYIPYYAFANRGPDNMLVWVTQK